MGWNGRERKKEREKRALNGEQTSLGSQKEVVWPPPSLSFASSSFSSYSCSTLPAKLLYEETTAGK